MEDPNVLQLAISYAELGQSLAFQDFLKMQAEESERLELIALNASPTQFEECRSSIIAWQQHRRIVRSLEELVQDAQRGLKSEQLENDDARSDPARTDRTGW
jgi:hypothetical protein